MDTNEYLRNLIIVALEGAATAVRTMPPPPDQGEVSRRASASSGDRVVDRLLLDVGEAANALGISRTKVYELIGTSGLPTVRVGRSRRVPADLLAEWVRSLPPG